MKTRTYDAIVIGAGISGLQAAWLLKQKGYHILLLEKENRVGGKIQTRHDPHAIAELGPDTFLKKSPRLLETIKKLGLTSRLIPSKEIAQKRFIYLKQRLIHLPIGLREFLQSPFLSWRGKLRLALEPFVRIKEEKVPSMTVADFFAKRMGKESVTNLFDPFVSGIYAGNVYKLGALENFGSMVQANLRFGSIFSYMKWGFARQKRLRKQGYQRKSGMYSFDQGLQLLTDTYGQKLKDNLQLQAQVQRLEKTAEGVWQLSWQDRQKKQHQDLARSVIWATPAFVAADYLAEHNTTLAQDLRAIPYPDLATGTLFYKPEDVAHPMDGFGYLIPRKQGIKTLGALWHGSLFPDHNPHGYKSFRFYIGGDTDHLTPQKSKSTIIDQVTKDIQTTMNLGKKVKPVYYHVYIVPHAIPQYYVGHNARIQRIQQELQKLPGLFLTGNYLGGVSLNDCLAQSNRTIYQAQQYLTTSTKE